MGFQAFKWEQEKMPDDWKSGRFGKCNSDVLSFVETNIENVELIFCWSRLINYDFFLRTTLTFAVVYLTLNPDISIEFLHWLGERAYGLWLCVRRCWRRIRNRLPTRIQNFRLPYTFSRNLRIYGGLAVIVSFGFWHSFTLYNLFYISPERSGFHSRISFPTSLLFQLIFLGASSHLQNGHIQYRISSYSFCPIPGVILLFFRNVWNRLQIVPIVLSHVVLISQYWQMVSPFFVRPIDARPRNGEAARIPRRILRPFANLPVVIRIMNEEDPENHIEEPHEFRIMEEEEPEQQIEEPHEFRIMEEEEPEQQIEEPHEVGIEEDPEEQIEERHDD